MPTNRTRRTRAWSPELTAYRRHELREMVYAVIGYSGYGDGVGKDAAAFADKMRADWGKHRDALIAYWTGSASHYDTFRENMPWLFHLPGGPGTRPWAWWHFDAPEPLGEDESQGDYLRRHGLMRPGECAEERPPYPGEMTQQSQWNAKSAATAVQNASGGPKPWE